LYYLSLGMCTRPSEPRPRRVGECFCIFSWATLYTSNSDNLFALYTRSLQIFLKFSSPFFVSLQIFSLRFAQRLFVHVHWFLVNQNEIYTNTQKHMQKSRRSCTKYMPTPQIQFCTIFNTESCTDLGSVPNRHHNQSGRSTLWSWATHFSKTKIIKIRYSLLKYTANHRRAVAQPCVNGDWLSKGRMAKFDPAQIRNPWTDRHKIWNRWLRWRDDPPCKISCKSVHWGLLSKWVKYNENFSSIYIYTFFLLTDLQVRPPGGFSRTMAQTTRSHARLKPFREPKFEVNI